jgi:hypothetical protein
VQSTDKAEEIVGLAQERGWKVTVGVETDQIVELSDLRRLMRSEAKPEVKPRLPPKISSNGPQQPFSNTTGGLRRRWEDEPTRPLEEETCCNCVKFQAASWTRSTQALISCWPSTRSMTMHPSSNGRGKPDSRGGAKKRRGNAEARPANRRRDLSVKELEQILGAQNLAHQIFGT